MISFPIQRGKEKAGTVCTVLGLVLSFFIEASHDVSQYLAANHQRTFIQVRTLTLRDVS